VRTSGLALVVLANMGAAAAGAFIGGFGAGLLRSTAVAGLVSVPAMLCIAYLVGRWATRREDPPTEQEIAIGCCAYVLLCVLLALATRHMVAVLFAMLGGFGVAFCFHRGAHRAGEKAAKAQAAPAAKAELPPPVTMPPSPGRRGPAVPDSAIKSALGIAVVVALGWMLSSFSWMTSTPTEASEPAYGGSSYAGPADAGFRPSTIPASNINPGQHVVQGYTRSNGTYVAPHAATNPDHDRTNNLSSTGNVNPYTGARGHR